MSELTAAQLEIAIPIIVVVAIPMLASISPILIVATTVVAILILAAAIVGLTGFIMLVATIIGIVVAIVVGIPALTLFELLSIVVFIITSPLTIPAAIFGPWIRLFIAIGSWIILGYVDSPEI